MLSNTPPGYPTATTNAQNLGGAGQQMPILPSSYLAQLYSSSYHAPSSYAIPSSVDIPNPYYSQQQQSPRNQMAQALAKGV